MEPWAEITRKSNTKFDSIKEYVDPHTHFFPLNRYLILDILGAGTFGQVVKCKNIETGEMVALKVIKNKPAYTKQSLIEVDILTHVRITTIEFPITINLSYFIHFS